MAKLTQQEQEIIFDYCLGIASEEESERAQELIITNQEAQQLHLSLKKAFAPLETLGPETASDELAEKTVSRLLAAKSAQVRLRQLIAYEQAQQQAQPKMFFRYVSRFVSVAAVLLIVAGVWGSTVQHMRFHAQKTICQSNLAGVGAGFQSYRGDNNGRLPMVATAAGDPWWKVGYRPDSNENASNTRHIFLLVRRGYITKPAIFVCPGVKSASGLNYDRVQVANLRDFPSRQHVSYSFRIRCPQAQTEANTGRKVLMTDMNPIFCDLPETLDDLKLQINEDLLKINSRNHNKKGQNILFCDGSVTFIKTRFIESDRDDVFTLQGTTLYHGTEIPTGEDDVFVAP